MDADEFIDFRLEFRVSRALVGSKTAIQFGDGPILVSPAMFALCKHASPDELETLLNTILVQHLPPVPSVHHSPTAPYLIDWDEAAPDQTRLA